MQRSTTFTAIFRVKELAKSVQPFSSDALTNEQHFIFIYRVYYEKPLVLYFPYFLSDFNKYLLRCVTNYYTFVGLDYPQ
jgi:hypothetical protein